MQNSLRRWVVVFFTLAFNFLFWQEKFGINLVLFTTLFGGILYWANPEQRSKLSTLLGIGGIVLSSAAILYHNSLFSKIMLFCSVFLFVASLVEKEIKTIYYLIPSGFIGIVTSPFRKNGFFEAPKHGPSGKTLKWIKLSFIPIAVTTLFTIIYSQANPVFKNKLNLVAENLGDYLANLFEHYPFIRFVFIALGLLIGIGVFYFKSVGLFDEREKKHQLDLKRERLKSIHRAFSMVALKAEKNSALVTLIMLNLLLLFVNLLDINVFFIQDSSSLNVNFSDNLHKGTWMLIFSIFLSAGVVLYIFRRNINFMPKTKLLKTITYIWIAQNIFLSFSVLVRVYHYIQHHGLAHKRIGVLFFVLATVVGLITLVIKVKNKKTVSYLFRANGISIFSILVLGGMINWDRIIASHNFENAATKNIDFVFELTLSNDVLPILDANRDKIIPHNNKYQNYRFTYGWVKNMTLTERLDERIREFQQDQEGYSWLSWNFSDQKTLEYFQNK